MAKVTTEVRRLAEEYVKSNFPSTKALVDTILNQYAERQANSPFIHNGGYGHFSHSYLAVLCVLSGTAPNCLFVKGKVDLSATHNRPELERFFEKNRGNIVRKAKPEVYRLLGFRD